VQVNNEAVAPATLRSPTRLRAEHDLVELVDAARNGDAGGWNELIVRYTPLVDSVCRDHRLSQADAEDVRQVVWVQLFQNLGGLRETRALPGWLRTTTKREALRVIAARRRIQPVDPSVLVMLDRQSPDEGVDRNLLRSERAEAVWDGLAELSPEHRRLLVLLHAESRPSYQAIGKTLSMPPGSIGPTRARCLAKLKKTQAIRTLLPVDDPDGLQAA